MSVARNGQPPLDSATIAVHAGRDPAPGAPLAQPPTFASVYRSGGHRAYGREGNPTWEAFESAVAALERGREAVAFASGMAAADALLATLERGAKVVIAGNAHVEVRRLLAERGADGRLDVVVADAGDEDGFAAAMAGAGLAWVDSISNPLLEVAPLRALATAARSLRTPLVVDATLATPVLQRPLELGASIVLHSAGKYLGGHSDLLLGVVACDEALLARQLRERREATGSVPGTMEAWLALRGLRTLPLRVARSQASAGLIARRLAAHPEVTVARHPGLGPLPPELGGPGGMVAFEVRGGAERADAVCEALRLIVHAGSLGGVESLIERHARWHREPSVPAGLLRLSVGCEDPDDLWHDLERALAVTTARGISVGAVAS